MTWGNREFDEETLSGTEMALNEIREDSAREEAEKTHPLSHKEHKQRAQLRHKERQRSNCCNAEVYWVSIEIDNSVYYCTKCQNRCGDETHNKDGKKSWWES